MKASEFLLAFILLESTVINLYFRYSELDIDEYEFAFYTLKSTDFLQLVLIIIQLLKW